MRMSASTFVAFDDEAFAALEAALCP